MTTIARRITGGVDTHLDTHVAAALDERGAQLGVQSFPATAAGYRELLDWLEGFGTVELIGVEGTGSYGAGLTRHLLGCHVTVVEIDRPNRQRRRRTGKSDPHDAVAALAMTAPELFAWRARPTRCETAGLLTTGATVVDRRPGSEGGHILVAEDVDVTEVSIRIIEAIRRLA